MRIKFQVNALRVKIQLLSFLVTYLYVTQTTFGQVTILGLSINGQQLSMSNSTLCSSSIINYQVKVDTSSFPQSYNSVDFYAIFSNKNGSFAASDVYKLQLWGVDRDKFRSMINGGIFTISGYSLVFDTLLNFPGNQYRVKFQLATIDDNSEYTSTDNGFDMSIYQIPPIPQVSNKVLELGQKLELTTINTIPAGNKIQWYLSVPEGTVTSFSNVNTLSLTGVSFPRTFYIKQSNNYGCLSDFNSVRVFPNSDYYCDELMYRVADLSQTSNNHRSICFLDELTGFVSSYGSVKKTENAGITWKSVDISTNFLIRDMQFISSTTGFVTGNRGIVAKTNDRGESWNILGSPSGSNFGFNSVKFINEQEGVVGTVQGEIYLTTNGGISWAQVYSSLPVLKTVIFDIQFLDSQIGYAIATGNYFYSEEKNLILKTTNRGRTWDVLSTITGVLSLTSLCFTGNNVFYASGGGGNSFVTNSIVYKSIDGGISWDLVLDTKSDYNFIYDMIMIDESKGYAATAQGNVLKTNDGWQSYYQINRMNQGYLEKYYLSGMEGFPSLNKLNDTTLYTNSFDGKVYKIIIPSLPKPTISGNFSELKSSAEYGNQWFLDNQSIPGANGKSYYPITTGSYSVRQSNSCKESQVSNAITITDLTKSTSINSLSFYPNPATSKVILPENIGKVNIYSSLGLKLETFSEGSKEIDIQGFKEGIYIVETENPPRRGNLVVSK